jgi:hypothetical protein
MGFDPYNHSLKIRESIETPTPKMWTHLGVWGLVPSHSPTVATLALGLRPRQKGYKFANQKGARESLQMLLGVQKSEWEWTLTLPKGVQLWELESWCTPKFSERDFKGQNSMAGRILYTIGKLLERKCLKWARITHLESET